MKRILSLLLFLISTVVLTLILLYVVQVYGGVELDMPEKMNEVFASVTGKNKMDEEHEAVDFDISGKVNEVSVSATGNNKMNDRHEAVDLGLSVKWATCNVGANRPEEYGGYYAWGEIEEKMVYEYDTYKWFGGGVTKYCISQEYGIVDERWTLELSDDVAHVQWRSGWRIPTSDELGELKDRCSWKWTSVNGVYGYKVIGPNGKSIFLPAAGSRYGVDINGHGLRGKYWSSTVCGGYDDRACYLLFDSNRPDSDYLSRESGLSVRPVRD